MFLLLFTLTSLVSPAVDPLQAALNNFHRLDSYRVTLRSSSRGSSETIQYSYKKPGFVRMDFLHPHRGAVLVFNPHTKKVRLRPFRFLKPLVLTLLPDSRFLISSQGHRVDESDIGSLLQSVIGLQKGGVTGRSGTERIGGRATMKISVQGSETFTVNGIHRYALWLDSESLLPLRAAAFDREDRLIERVLMDDLEINVEFPDGFFDL